MIRGRFRRLRHCSRVSNHHISGNEISDRCSGDDRISDRYIRDNYPGSHPQARAAALQQAATLKRAPPLCSIERDGCLAAG